MTIIVGTRNGVFKSLDGTLDEYERVLDSGDTLCVRTLENHAGVFAASKTGLYRSLDNGHTWDSLDVPQTEVYSVAGSPDGKRLYAGTHPAHLYTSTEKGDWIELEGFQDLPSRGSWHTNRHRGQSHVRSLGVHPDSPARLIAGVEVGGIHISDDYGETWVERRDDLRIERTDDLQYDVHHVLVLTSEEYVISCGGGLYRTRDSGITWTRLGENLDESYFQEAFTHEGTLFAAAQTFPPTLPLGSVYDERDVNAALLESRDGGDTFERKRYPGEPFEYIYAWTATPNGVVAGTTQGQLITRRPDGWRSLGNVPSLIRSLQSTEE